jgi:hypothetical protein
VSIDLVAATRDGVLTIDGVAMQRLAWAVLDVTPLWLGPDQRGQDLEIPGRPGALPNPRRAATTSRTLRMVIDGQYDPAGVWQSNPRQQLRRNISYLREHVSDPTYIGDGRRTITLVTPDGVTYQGHVHIGALQLGDQVQGVARAALPITITDGALTETGP